MTAPAMPRLRFASVPILMYHQVTPASTAPLDRYAITPRRFAAHMRVLSLARYHPITIAELVGCWRERKAPPPRAVVITFDDGFRDCIEFAVPVLQHHRFRAVFYLVAGLLGTTSRWMRAGGGPEYPLMDWAAARGLQDIGMQCGAHSLTHPALADCSPAEARRELIESRKLLEDRLGQGIDHFAYPYGSVTPQVRDLAADAGYLSACATDRRLATAGDDWLQLPRVPVYGGESLVDFVCRLRTAESPQQLLRNRLPLVRLLRKARRRAR
jgi:peptidoglycan/xylan/chitin deacetylase (PgdA/CDA1 family)